ncbi:MAG: hypothetical protein OXE44_12095 [Nitrospinae bacterium]|nr:hypothetical protein [Nitrospinota bacterium]
MKKRIYASVAFMFFVSGCAGSGPNPVARFTPADEKRNCASLKSEIKAIKKDIAKKTSERTDKTYKNLTLGAAGVFLVVPWFFMDLKGKEAAETEALERRNAALRRVAFVKGCNEPLPILTHQRKPKTGEKAK